MHHGCSPSCLWKRTLKPWHQFHSHIIHPEPGTETDNYIYTNKTFKIVGMSRLCTYLSWPHSRQSPDLLRYARAETKEGMNSQVLCLGMRPCTSPSLGMRPCTFSQSGNETMHLSQSGNETMHLFPVWEWDHAPQTNEYLCAWEIAVKHSGNQLLSLGVQQKERTPAKKDHKQHARVVPHCMCNLRSPALFPGSGTHRSMGMRLVVLQYCTWSKVK